MVPPDPLPVPVAPPILRANHDVRLVPVAVGAVSLCGLVAGEEVVEMILAESGMSMLEARLCLVVCGGLT